MTSDKSGNEKSLNKEILTIGVPSFLESLFTTFASILGVIKMSLYSTL